MRGGAAREGWRVLSRLRLEPMVGLYLRTLIPGPEPKSGVGFSTD